MSILRRDLAPVTAESWSGIDETAAVALKLNLAGRKLVDVKGPFGWEYGAVNLGRLDLSVKNARKDDVAWGLRKVLPLVELRIPFLLEIMELDNGARGAADVDFDPVARAAEQVARFEDDAIFNGLPAAGIEGILSAATHKPVAMRSVGDCVAATVEACELLRESGIQEPYALVLGTEAFKDLTRATDDGYPVKKTLERQVLDGPVIHAPALSGGLVTSTSGGNYELTLGQDLSIGYASHDKEKVELYITESFMFRVLEPAAAVPLKIGKAK
jgi:uncharacterized linocin/CFP29 family protein